MVVKLIVIALLIVILGSLGSAMFYLLRDRGESNRTVQALTVRIGLSFLAFLILMGGYFLGYIQPHSPFPH